MVEIIYGDNVRTNEAISQLNDTIKMINITDYRKDELEQFNNVVNILSGEYDEYSFHYRDIHCIVWRNPITGSLNGYVQNNLEVYGDIRCHNNISYCSTLDGMAELALGGEMYIGFHCAEMYDFQPLLASMCLYGLLSKHYDITYKDFDFISKECMSIVDQLIAISESK